MLDKPQIVRTDTQPTAVIHLSIPRAEIQDLMGPAIGEVMAAVAAQGMAPAGPVFSHHLRMDPAVFDFEVGVPVRVPISAMGRVTPGQLPAATVARVVYRGPYDGLGPAWAEFSAWLADEGHAPAPDLWESYVSGPEWNADPATWRTELNRPLIR